MSTVLQILLVDGVTMSIPAQKDPRMDLVITQFAIQETGTLETSVAQVEKIGVMSLINFFFKMCEMDIRFWGLQLLYSA